MNTYKIIPYILFLSVIVSSCAYVYFPNRVNAPLLSQKKEFQGNLTVGTSGADIQFAYSPVKHLGIIASVSYANDDTTKENYDIHKYYDLGVGYYKKLGRKFIFETYAGFGGGNVISQGEFLNTTFYSNMNLTKFYLQPAIGYSTNYLNFGITTRLSSVTFHPVYGNEDLTNKAYFFFEPALFTSLGYKHIFFTLQLGLSLTNMPSKSYMPVIFNAGIGIKLGNIFLPPARYSR